MQSKAEIWSIQYLRAVAAVSVVAFHMLQGRWLFDLGKYGVDVFFVISGFIVVAITDRRPVAPRQFFLDRLTRIVPLYWVATAMVFFLGWFGAYSTSLESSFSAEYILKSLLFIPAEAPYSRQEIWPLYYLGWTLNYEMFFYVVFASTLVLPTYCRLPALTIIFVALTAIGFFYDFQNPVLATYLSPRLMEFLSGALLGRIFGFDLKNRRFREAILYSSLISGCLLILGIAFPELGPGAAAGLLVSTFLVLDRCNLVPRLLPLKALGDASYSIYLVQEFAYLALISVAPHLGLGEGGKFYGLVCVVAIVSGLAAHRWLEVPLTRNARLGLTRLLDRRRKSAGASSS